MLHSTLLAQLEEVARRGSIRAAAEVLSVSASSINRRILGLEAELGAPLFDRHAGGMRMTVIGEVVLAHIRKTLLDHEQMSRRIREMLGSEGPRVRITAMHGMTAGVIPSFLRLFRSRHPEIDVTVRSQAEALIERDLATGECDLGLGYSWPNGTGIPARWVFTARLGAVMSRDHPLASKRVIRLAEIAEQPIALPDESVAINLMVTEAFASAGYPLRPIILSNSIELLKSMARAGEAVTFLSRIDVDEDLVDGQLVCVPIYAGDIASHELRIGRRKDSAQDQIITLAEDCLREVISRIESPRPDPADFI